MPTIKIRVPTSDLPFYGGGRLSLGVKAQLTAILDDLQSNPAPDPPSRSLAARTEAIWVSDEQMEAIESLGRTHTINGASPVASGLLHAAARKALMGSQGEDRSEDTDALTTLDKINRALGDRDRVDQQRLYRDMLHELARQPPERPVIFAEASTGVGKTRAFLAILLDWVENRPKNSADVAVIAMPGYSVLLQTLAQWWRMKERMGQGALPDLQVLLGQQEFVSEQALRQLLDEHCDVPGAESARDWLDAGGPAAKDDPIGSRWMMRSLNIATRGLWTHSANVVLTPDAAETDGGMKAYRRQFIDATQCRVLLCTHAMLGVEVRRRMVAAQNAYKAANAGKTVSDTAWHEWNQLIDEERRTSMTWEVRNDLLRSLDSEDHGRLPPIGLLIVDEAHLLEQSFASVFATGISLTRLIHTAQAIRETHPRSITAQQIEELGSVRDEMILIGRMQGGKADRLRTDENVALRESVARLRKALADMLDRMKGPARACPPGRRLQSVKYALDVAVRAAGERMGLRTSVSWSPDVQWPSIQTGRYDVSRELDFLWNIVVKDRTILVSATLYEDVSTSGLESMRRILSVRASQMRQIVPVRPTWLFEPVTLYLPAQRVHLDGLPRYRRPTKQDNLHDDDRRAWLERWRSDIARYIQEAHESAAGGTLVLLTSHDERKEIWELLLPKMGGETIMTQKPGASMDGIRQAFLLRVSRGIRPCLLAVGSAWTGLDISADGLASMTGQNVPARDDNILTDLIIPNVPLGTNRSLTQEYRRERYGTAAEAGATIMTLRQGMGRLVRRDGLPHNRRIHMLDSRIHESKWQWIMAPVMRSLRPYTRRQEV